MSILDGLLAPARAEQTSPAPPPEVLKALLDHLISTSGRRPPPAPDSLMTPEGLKALASLVSAVAWPLLVFGAVVVLLPELRSLLARLSDVEVSGIKARVKEKVETELKASADEARRAGTQLSTGPTAGEFARALQVERLASGADISYVRREAERLAAEYERIRASMPFSDERTRLLEVVMAQMRTIGRAALPLRFEFAHSPSPGRRLQAIASLQVEPDFEFLPWLAERPKFEKPFVAYHAMVALNAAARDSRAPSFITELEEALLSARRASERSKDAGVEERLAQFAVQVDELRKASRGRPAGVVAS